MKINYLHEKKFCTGCHACFSICPKNCIKMEEDTKDGFLYPVILPEKCSRCLLCSKICPVKHQNNVQKPLYINAVKNSNEEIRTKSSSGGMFSLLGERIIKENGVVFGARFNTNWIVEHNYTETLDGLAFFRGSKYIESNIGSSYVQVKQFLDNGRRVLFTGTPCQIAGLKAFLQKDYNNLLTVDLICAGVSSPGVWKKYLHEYISTFHKNKEDIIHIGFRNKTYGWKIFTFEIQIKDIQGTISKLEPSPKNTFINGFFANLYLRSACYNCPVKSFKSNSDITIGDYWGIEKNHPGFDDNKGISFVSVNSLKGKEIYDSLQKLDIDMTGIYYLQGNPDIENSAVFTAGRNKFFRYWKKTPLIPLINSLTLTNRSFNNIARGYIVKILRKLGLLQPIKQLLGRI
jgi:coenzyme F420-reducing hydrogenase beta subunit